MRAGPSAALVSCCALFFSTFARPVQAEPSDRPATPPDPERPYGGVTLDGGAPPTVKTPPAGLQYVTWPGFRADKRLGAEVFLQLTGPVTYKARTRGRRVEVLLEDVQVYLRNNLRPVLTKHFPGPVERFALRELKGNKLRLEIQLSRARKPAISIEQKHPPYTYLIVHFSP